MINNYSNVDDIRNDVTKQNGRATLYREPLGEVVVHFYN